MGKLMLVLVSLLGTSPAQEKELEVAFAPTILSIERHGGPAPTAAAAYYHYVVKSDGTWEFSPLRTGKPLRGQLRGDTLKRWLKELEDHGLFRQSSNEKLGENHEPYLIAVLHKEGVRHRVKIVLENPLAQRVDRKVIEMVKPVDK